MGKRSEAQFQCSCKSGLVLAEFEEEPGLDYIIIAEWIAVHFLETKELLVYHAILTKWRRNSHSSVPTPRETTAMAAFGFFRYVYLKALVTFIRSLVLLRDRLSPRIPDSTKWRQIRIPTRDPGRFIEGRAYGPQPEISNGKLPVLINWHGSGFVIPLFGTDHAFCSRVARETGFLVLDVDYRKAPESPYPGPVDDVEDTLRWIASDHQNQPACLAWSDRSVFLPGYCAHHNL